jgi:hypothetical protein
MSIAVLGWGSLIWDPRGLDVEPDWHLDGPLLPIEFARVSNRDRLTLVVVESAPLQPTLWTTSRKLSLEDARADLMRREELLSNRGIGCWPSNLDAARSKTVHESVEAWARKKNLGGVVWTALGPKCPEGRQRLASEDELISYLRRLEKEGRADEARRYIENAHDQIRTPLRKRIRKEIRWG